MTTTLQKGQGAIITSSVSCWGDVAGLAHCTLGRLRSLARGILAWAPFQGARLNCSQPRVLQAASLRRVQGSHAFLISSLGPGEGWRRVLAFLG